MPQARNTIVTKFIIVATLVLFMVTQHPGVLSSAEAVKATVAVKHKPLKYFVAGHRIQVEAKVTDTQGVSLVRCYFRAAGQADYVFVGMKAREKDVFTGILPSPAAETKGIEYLFLTVNGKNQVVKTQVFRTERKDTKDIPAWQSASAEGTIVVSTELSKATAPNGFTDSITTDVVESSARFGTVAGIYIITRGAGSRAFGTSASGGASTAGGTTGTAATAVFAGTVVASVGISTMMIVGASAAVVAAAAGVAVATGGGGGSDTTTSGCDLYAGNWVCTASRINCKGFSSTDRFTIIVEGNCVAKWLNCHGEVHGDSIAFDCGPDACGGRAITEGRFTSPTSVSGTWRDSGGGSGTWSGTRQ